MAREKTAALLLAAIMASTVVACSSSPTQQSTGQAIDDGVVTAKVKAKLIDDPMTKAHQINVETFKGTVQLSGFVDDSEARSRATQVAKNVEGVRDVTRLSPVLPVNLGFGVLHARSIERPRVGDGYTEVALPSPVRELVGRRRRICVHIRNVGVEICIGEGRIRTVNVRICRIYGSAATDQNGRDP